ncbi:MAG: magnesium/cobalt transporter CorA [Polyangiaceae bacterium]
MELEIEAGPESRHPVPIEESRSAPGTLHIRGTEKPRIFLVDYSAAGVIEKELTDIDECVPFLDREDSTTWVDVRGISHLRTFERIGEIFKLHPLALEDCTNVPQRPKTDIYDEQQVIITRMANLSRGKLFTEQLAIVLGHRFVLTVQEEPETDCLDPLRARLRSGRGNIRKAGSDYLAYALVDAVIDGFYPLLEHYGEALEELELRVASMKHTNSREIFDMKRELLDLRRAIWPQRDLMAGLMRDDSPHITAETRLYMRDSYDHVVQVMDMVESFREIASSLMDLFMSGVSNRMNEIMKVLTILSTIFLPMTFVAGVYGMNFNTEKSSLNMPELNWVWGYPFALALMALSALLLLGYYWRKGWIGSSGKRPFATQLTRLARKLARVGKKED